MAEVTRIKGGTDNCYIVSEDGKAVLIDTASAASFDKVITECDKYEMKLIILTHVHFDHAENAAILSKRYEVPVAFCKLDEELFESFDKQPIKPKGIVGRVVLGLSLKVLRNTKITRPEKVVYLTDGDDISSYGINAKIISLPGHTKGSIGVDVEWEHLFVGDELDNWVKPGVGHLYNDLDAIEKSAEKIRALGSRTIYYGHGNPSKNGVF